MLYKLLTEYGIGWNFNKTLQAMYDNHEVFVRVAGGLLQPILTKIGLKQGCGISPLLFNLFIDKITTIFDRTCDPVSVGGEDISHYITIHKNSSGHIRIYQNVSKQIRIFIRIY